MGSLVSPVCAEEREDVLPDVQTTQLCRFYGEFAEQTASLRDEGVPMRDVIKDMQATGRQAIPGADIFIQDQVSAQLKDMIEMIYASPRLSPVLHRQLAYKTCMNTSAPQGQQ
jgi:hypothetical protein